MFSLGKSNAPYTIATYIKGKKVIKRIDFYKMIDYIFII
jgi:hypothetical protein